ncbi:MAG TPA: class I SAM-dependent methyltransferase [Candidatus Omnitrophota bacterium]|nr:class I SAM-dependent methyltransferase [Candidatus Omnitrophota bacterium]
MPTINQTTRTKETYSYLWKQGTSGIPLDRWHFDDLQEMVPEKIVRGTLGLEAGSGKGYDTNIMARNNPCVKIVSLDLSDGVYESKKINVSLNNVRIIQGSILTMPFMAGIFDFAYSFGVLHHTPDPNLGIKEINRVLKPGAPVFLYLYEDHSENVLKHVAITITTLIRKITTRINKKLLYFFCTIASPFIFILFSIPARILRVFKYTARIADWIPFNFGKSLFSLKGDLYDRFSAPLEFRYSRKEARDFLQKNGFEKVTVTHLHEKAGWLVWGYKTQC